MLEIKRLKQIKCDYCHKLATIEITNDKGKYHVCNYHANKLVGEVAVFSALFGSYK